MGGERNGGKGEKVRREGSKRVTKAIRENHENRGGGGVCGVVWSHVIRQSITLPQPNLRIVRGILICLTYHHFRCHPVGEGGGGGG